MNVSIDHSPYAPRPVASVSTSTTTGLSGAGLTPLAPLPKYAAVALVLGPIITLAATVGIIIATASGAQ